MRAWLIAFVGVVGCGGSSASSVVPVVPAVEPAGAVAADPAATPVPGTVVEGSFRSEALGVDKRYFVYLPGGYDGSGDRRYPVIYMLHGLGGSEDNWTRYMGLAEAADALGLQAIVVMPDGDDGFYVNWASDTDYDACMAGKRPFGRERDMATYCVHAPRYEDYVAVDLVGHVDATYRTIDSRDARAIGGLSMGGYGALVIGLRHRDLFGSIASHSGVDALLCAGPWPYERGKVKLLTDPMDWIRGSETFGAHFERIFGRDLANWRAHDPAALVADLDDGEVALYLDCGDADELRLHNGMQYLHELLEARGVSHAYHLVPGGTHQLDYWKARVDDSLAFHAASFDR